MTWAATKAKAKFSEVLDKAETEGPQVVRRRKREFVLLTREAHEAALATNKVSEQSALNAWDALRPSFQARYDVDFPRLKGKPRKANLG